MSCFGKVVLLPNGEVVDAATAAAAAAAAAAAGASAGSITTVKAESKTDEKAKPKPKADEQQKVEPKTRYKTKFTCERKGGGIPDKGEIRCTYYCPGDPPSFGRVIRLPFKECPPYWDFWL